MGKKGFLASCTTFFFAAPIVTAAPAPAAPMPNITLVRQHLFESIGRTYTDKEFDELCFEFGVEVDDVETETIEVGAYALHNHERYPFLTLLRLSSPRMVAKRSMWCT